MRKIAVLSILLASACAFLAQTDADFDTRRIISLENAWNQAQWQKDRIALEMLLDRDLVYVEYDGTLLGKAEYIAGLLAPSLRPARITSESMKVHVYGEFAVVTGIYRESGLENGKPYSRRMRFTDTWMRRNQNWVCVASQSTPIV